MNGVQGRSSRAGWLFADVAIALAFLFLASASSLGSREAPSSGAVDGQVPAPTEQEDPPVSTTSTSAPVEPCEAVVTRFGDAEASSFPLIHYSLNSDPNVVAEALRSFLAANEIEGVRPAFVQVFGVSVSGDTAFEISLANSFSERVLPLVIEDDVIVDSFQGTRRDADGVDLLWYIATC